MNISDEHQTGSSENNSPQEQREAPTPPRHADWISYAVAVTQEAPADDLPSDSEF